VRIGAEAGEEKLLALYSDVGRAFARFKGWRAACFVANPRFVDAFGYAPVMTKPRATPTSAARSSSTSSDARTSGLILVSRRAKPQNANKACRSHRRLKISVILA
jgi:hypothetical protein